MFKKFRLNVYEKFIEDLCENKNFIPNINKLSENRFITLEFIEKHIDWNWNVDYLSRNPNITLEFIENHKDWNWDMECLSDNPLITPEFIEKYPNGFAGNPWDMNKLSKNPNITPEFVERNINGKGLNLWWNMYLLSANPSITLEFIEKHSDWKWSMDSLYWNRNITLKFMEKYPNGIGGEPWNMQYLSANPNITPEFIEKYPDLKWNINLLSGNPNITAQFVKKHINWDWNIHNIIARPNRHFFDILKILLEHKNKELANIRILLYSILDSSLPSVLCGEINQNIIEEDIINYKRKLSFLLGCYKNKNIPLSIFKNNILFDPHLIKLIFSYL